MSKKVMILSDSTADLGELFEKRGIKVVPLGVTLGGKTYKDGVDIKPADIYANYEKTSELPKTSAVNIGEYSEIFKKYTEEGYEIVSFSISSEMSSSFNNARIAAADFEGVYTVDTKNLSTGGGLLVLYAADMADEGKGAAEIAEKCASMAEKVDASFVIDSLEFLHKGGRCSSLAALGANLFKLKPCIVVQDGKMSVAKKYRGAYAAVLREYIADRIGDGSGIDKKRVFITHGGTDESIVRACVEQVKAYGIFDEIYATTAGCTISSHCGRDTLGVLFIRENKI